MARLPASRDPPRGGRRRRAGHNGRNKGDGLRAWGARSRESKGRPLEIEYFREFVDLADSLNFRETAERMNMSQSALSKHIAALEGYFDTTLFVRDKHQVSLTESGAYLLECAKEVCQTVDWAKKTIATRFSGAHVLRCGGVIDNVGDYPIVAEAASQLRKADPSNHVTLEKLSNASVEFQLEEMRKGSVDCIATYDTREAFADVTDVSFIAVCDIPLEVTVSPDNPIAQMDKVPASALNGQRLVQLMGPRYTDIWRVIRDRLLKTGIEFHARPVAAMSSYDFTLSVYEGLGDSCFVAPRRGTPTMILKGGRTVTVPIDPDELTLGLGLVYLTDKKPVLVDEFAAALGDAYRASYASDDGRRK